MARRGFCVRWRTEPRTNHSARPRTTCFCCRPFCQTAEHSSPHFFLHGLRADKNGNLFSVAVSRQWHPAGRQIGSNNSLRTPVVTLSHQSCNSGCERVRLKDEQSGQKGADVGDWHGVTPQLHIQTLREQRVANFRTINAISKSNQHGTSLFCRW